MDDNGKIYSNINPEVLLHQVVRLEDISHKRWNVSSDDEYLQLGVFRMDNGKTFRPHKHLILKRETDITQESWVVIKGKVKAILFDLDDSVIAEPILGPGDASMTFHGGHTYECLEDDTVVYEYKTGPYFGQADDKAFITDPRGLTEY